MLGLGVASLLGVLIWETLTNTESRFVLDAVLGPPKKLCCLPGKTPERMGAPPKRH